MAPGKRKRPDRSSVDSGENRPSPHRPGNTNLGQHDRGTDMRDGGGRRSSRGVQGGQGGGRGRGRNDGRDNQNKLTISARATPTPGPMSPPPPRPSSATQTPTPTVDITSPVPRPDPTPFEYIFLTDDRLASWDTGGRQDVIVAGIQARQDEDTMDLASIFQELIRATLDGRLEAGDAGNCVKAVLGPDTAPADEKSGMFDPQTFFLDTFSMIFDAEEGDFNTVLRTFIAATGISPIAMRQKLDGLLLQKLGLTRDTFIRVGIRQATHLLYRQANYNLLREETEGYSKLVTELFTTSGSEPPFGEVVEDAFEKVKGLIGTFDLDVGRVLDITLDVFAAVLIKHYRFFIKLLRVSSWWPRNGETDGAAAARCAGLPRWALPSSPGWLPTDEDDELSRHQRTIRDTAFWGRAREVGLDAFFELGGRQMVDEETKKRIFSDKGSSDAELDADRQWIEGTGTFPPSGNRIAAQLLGFKLRFYASAARDNDDILPANLIYLTALLIKIGFISLRDLYPHLWPLDDDMPAIREAKQKEMQEKERLNRPGGGASNALTMAGALADDTLPNGGRTRETVAAKIDPTAKATAESEDKDKLDEPADQKVQLLICLLTIGAIPESLFILGRFPWLPEAYPELYDLIHRILSHSIKDVYEMSRPLSSQDPACRTKTVADTDQSGVPKGQVRLVQLPSRKQLRWPFPDKFDTNENNSYRFYWDEWADNVPVCQSVDDVFTLCGTLLNYSGVNIGRDASFLSKLARIGAKSLADDPSNHNLERWQDLLKRLLVPALSLTKSNTSVVNEIYDMLRFYPVPIRYSIYAEWFEGQTSRLPTMKVAFARTRLETLSTMKRISMTNLTAMARSLAKTAYASPGIVFTVALSQIEAYTNLTEVVVECAKYFTDLGYDVLVWSLMSSLGGKDRNRNNSEFALLPSRWLLALSRFSGKVFKRYSIMNLSPIVQYVNDQLYRGNSTDLVILKELIAQMAGVVPDTDFTDAQLAAMTGGEILRKQTLINLQDKRYESTKTAKRLMRALTETKLAGQLLLSIAQHRQSAIYAISDDEAHIKLLATMIDDTQMIMFQYLDLLRSNLSVEDFDKHVPGIPELMTDFGLDPTLAFLIGRASLAYRMANVPSPMLNGVTKSLPAIPESALLKIDVEGDVPMDSVEAPKTNSEQATENLAVLANGSVAIKEDVQMADIREGGSPAAIEPSIPSVDPFQEILEPIILTAQAILPEDIWKALSPELYVMFWTSTLGDLSIPSNSYEAEISRLMKEQSEVMKDRTDMSRPGMLRKEEAKKALAMTRESLLAEFGKQVGTFGQTRARLLRRKSSWFEHSMKADTVSDTFLEKCLIPRLLLSPSDADFCFRIIKFLHDNGTPNFRTLSLYGRIFRAHRLRSLIFTCSVREAENLGRFLRLVLADLARWHANAAVYEKEAWGQTKNLPGFAKALNNDGTPKGFLDHDGTVGFRNVLLSWHKNLNTALRDCLEGTEWMHIRNAITVLKSVVEVFPAVDFMGNSFIKQLELIAKREKDVREDLSLTGNAVLVQLKKKSKSWVMVQAFGHNLAPVQTNGSPAKATASANTPSKVTLNATAPEFKPQSRASSMGASTPRPSAVAEVEDGEVDDAKISAITDSTSAAKPGTPARNAAEAKPVAPTAPTTSEPKRSDVLTRRDQILREKEAKASTPPPSQAGIPARPDVGRNLNVGSLPERSNHHLPTRPDAPFPGRQQLDRHPSSRHGDRRDGRDTRLPDSGRMDRPGDRPRDFSGTDRRGIEANPRDFGRASERGLATERERSRPDPPPRWTPDSSRENLERSTNGARGSDTNGRLSRENGMPPPRSSAVASDRAPPINPERIPLVNPERQELINPERAALISGGKSPVRSDSPRRSRDDQRDRTSRPQSPNRRYGANMEHPDPRRDDRSSRNGPADLYNSSRSRADENQPPPAGPRSDRPGDRAGERGSGDRSRDAPLFQSITSSRPVDPEHGRLNPTPRQPPDPNFGRLNPTPVSDIPSGPRDRNTRGNRMPSAAQPRRDGRPAEAPRPPTPEKKPPTVPTGPSLNRHPRRSASGQFDAVSSAPTSVPTTPAAASPSPAIHPDRLKQLDPQAVHSTSQSQTTTSAPVAGIHPDRLKAFNNEPPSRPAPPASQSGNSNSRPPLPAVVTAIPPSGPKGSQSSPISSGANGLAAPTGPASATERAARGGRRQLAGINTMLQQAGQQNGPDRINVRGRGARMNSTGQPETPTSAPSTPAPPPPPPPPARPEPVRETGRADLINPERADLITGNAAPVEDRDRDRSSRRERSGRHSRRSSRSPDRSRDAKRAPPEEDRAPRSEHRDRRGGERGEPERDRHQGRSPPGRRDLIAGRDAAVGGRDGDRERERERDRESGRRDGRERDGGRDQHESGWGGGADHGGERGERGGDRGGRRGDEAHRRDTRDMRGLREDGGGRKRRSDEGGMDSRGHDKRPRR